MKKSEVIILKSALLLVDLQKDFCKNGALEVNEGDEVIKVANKMAESFSKAGNLIIATKDWHPDEHKSFAVNSNAKIGEIGELNGLMQVWWPKHCVMNTLGSEFHDELNSEKIDKVIYKGMDKETDSYSAFFDNGKKNKTELDGFLKEKGIDTLYIMGLATDYCVKYTVLDALSLGYKVYLVKEGCRGVNINPEDSENAIKEMEKSGTLIISIEKQKLEF